MFDGKSALRAGAGVLAGFVLLALVGAAAIALLVPLPSAGLGLRLEHHLFDAAETVGVGAVAAALAACAALVPRPRWASPLAMAVLAGPVLYVAIGDDLRRAASFVPDSRFEGLLFALYVVAFTAMVPVVYGIGGACARSARLRAAAVVLATAGMIADHLVLADDYDGIHGVVGLFCAIFAGAALAPVAERAVRRMARFSAGRIALAVLGAFALFGLSWPPPNAVRCQLFRRTSAMASWALAATVWRSPRPHAPVTLAPSPWLRDRAADPPVPPTVPRLVPEDAVVVLVTIDAVRADVVDDPANDGLLRTLASLEREGVYFRHATAPGTQTAISLGTVFSGRSFSELYWSRYGEGPSRFEYPADDPSPRFPALLSAHGVDTASFDSLLFLRGDFGVSRGFRDDRAIASGRRQAPARELIGPLLQKLESARRGPLFLYTHLTEPHAPYDRGRSQGTDRERYLSEIGVADLQLARVLHVLRRSFGDRWVLVVTSDHGEAFGDHQTYEHGKTLYEELLHVPLLVASPRIAPRTIDQRVSLADLGPTILDLFGVPTPATYDGQSLVPLLAGEDAVLTRPIVSEGRLRRALTLPDGLKVIDDPRRKLVEVYDLAADPGETRNLFDAEPARADRALAELRAFLDAHTLKKEGYRPPFKL